MPPRPRCQTKHSALTQEAPRAMAQFIRETVADGGAVIEIYRNDSGSTISKGYPVALSGTTADGVGITLGSSNYLHVGVAYEDIIDGAYGRVQVAGYVDYAVVTSGVTLGDSLVGSATGYALQGNSPPFPRDAAALESVAVTGSGHKIWLGHAC